MWKISNNMASVTLGSNSPTYNEALAGLDPAFALFAAALAGVLLLAASPEEGLVSVFEVSGLDSVALVVAAGVDSVEGWVDSGVA